MTDAPTTSGFENPSPKPPASAPVSGTDTVIIASKYANDLELTYYDLHDEYEPTQTGVRSVKRYRRNAARSFTVAGSSTAANPHVPGSPLPIRLLETSGGYALTSGCPRETWQWWAEHNAARLEADMMRAFDSIEDAQRWCRTKVDLRSGFEPLDPARPELTVGRPLNRGLSNIQPGHMQP